MEDFKVVFPSKLHGNAIDLSGQRFGRWSVVCPTSLRDQSNRLIKWVCKCDCGGISYVLGSSLRAGDSTQCLSCAREQFISDQWENSPHLVPTITPVDRVLTREYTKYQSMERRCDTVKHYIQIEVCPSWRRRATAGNDGQFSGYTQFVCDMGPCPEGYELDRKDPNGDYTPENCWWSPSWFQRVNTRNLHKLLHKMHEKDWSAGKVLRAMGVDPDSETPASVDTA